MERPAPLLRAACLFAALFCAQVSATPQIVRVDGSVFNATGVPFTGTSDIQIKVYDASTAGNLLWTSSVYAASVTSGRFSIPLDTTDTSVSSPSLASRMSTAAASDAFWFEIHYDVGTGGNGAMNSDRTIPTRIRARGSLFALASPVGDSLAGVTTTVAEWHALSGLTANIQTQLNAKGGVLWTTLTAGTTASVNSGYITNSASLIGVTLPANCTVGDVIHVVGQGSGGWKIYQGAGQTIATPWGASTSGAGGFVKSVDTAAAVELVCRVQNTDWQLVSSTGNFQNDTLTSVSAFTSTGYFTVPAGVTKITIKAWGGGGGSGATLATAGGDGGGGAYATTTTTVKPGEVLLVLVGNGGQGGLYLSSSSGGGGGGGFSTVVQNANPLLIAAGGGGGGGGYNSPAAGDGGAGGFLTGEDGEETTMPRGRGATSYTGGEGYLVWQSGATYGARYLGGLGGYYTTAATMRDAPGGAPGGSPGGRASTSFPNYFGGGGGGGGLFGGGGGSAGATNPNASGVGGGGGSSFGTSGSDGSRKTPGNNTDTDYTSYAGGTAGVGATGTASSNSNGSAGNNGLVVIKW